MSSQQSGKSPAVAWALWFFLGGFGAHRFYFGKVKSGAGMAGLLVASAVLTVVVIGFLGYLALAAWWVYDAFQMNKWLSGEQAAQPAHGTPEFASQDGAPAASSGMPGMTSSTSQSEAA
jgi:TM2 domain-containing membrane protein YozV